MHWNESVMIGREGKAVCSGNLSRHIVLAQHGVWACGEMEHTDLFQVN